MSREYIQSGNVINQILTKGCSLREAFASIKRIGKIDYLLAIETLKYLSLFQQLLLHQNTDGMDKCDGVIQNSHSIDRSPTIKDDMDKNIENKGLFYVMMYELLIGKGKIRGGGKIKKQLLQHEQVLRDRLNELLIGKNQVSELLPQKIQQGMECPKYIRVNTMLWPMDEALQYLKELTKKHVHIDELIPSLIVLPSTCSGLGLNENVLNGKLIIQDKSSCFPSQILIDSHLNHHLEGSCHIMDACAAPGNKTSHMAIELLSSLHSTSHHQKIFAFDKSTSRVKVLRERMKQSRVNSLVEVIKQDFLSINSLDSQYNQVTSILVDPSCSGSGIIRSVDRLIQNHSIIDDDEEGQQDGRDDQEEDRIQSLKSFQIQVVLKAMTFPNVQRVVYSTCSVHNEENEEVVSEVLELVNQDHSPNEDEQDSKWDVVAPNRFMTWKRRGLEVKGLTSIQSKALIRCAPEDGMNGFFVALFERKSRSNKVPWKPSVQLEVISKRSLYENIVPVESKKKIKFETDIRKAETSLFSKKRFRVLDSMAKITIGPEQPIFTSVQFNTSTANSTSMNSTHALSSPSQRLPVIITFVNGIYHSSDDWSQISQDLESIFNAPVRPFYNPSSGSWLQDASKAGYALILKPDDEILSLQLANHLRKTLKEVGEYGRILHIAHSAGAILTYLAAKHHLTPEETSRIDVITFGGGRSITHKYFRGSRIINYYAKNDPVLVLETRANKLLKIGMERLKTSMENDYIPQFSNGSCLRIKDTKHNTTFVYVPGLTNNPIFDHSMTGPTYRTLLQYESIVFKSRLQEIKKYISEKESFVRLIRKKSAAWTGIHHFWDEFHPINITKRMQDMNNMTISVRDSIISQTEQSMKTYWNQTFQSFQSLQLTWNQLWMFDKKLSSNSTEVKEINASISNSSLLIMNNKVNEMDLSSQHPIHPTDNSL